MDFGAGTISSVSPITEVNGMRMKIEAANKVIYDGPLNGITPLPQSNFEFFPLSVHHNNASSPLAITITFDAPNGLKPNTDITVTSLQVGLAKTEKLINPSTLECVTHCPDRIGY